MSDLVLAAQPGYAFENPPTGETVVDVPDGASRGSPLPEYPRSLLN